MVMVEHFEDIQNKIKELGCVASLVVIEATKVSNEVFKSQETYPSVLQVLTHLVAQQLNIEAIRLEYKQNQQLLEVKRQIDETKEREKLREQQDAVQRTRFMQQWNTQQNQF